MEEESPRSLTLAEETEFQHAMYGHDCRSEKSVDQMITLAVGKMLTQSYLPSSSYFQCSVVFHNCARSNLNLPAIASVLRIAYVDQNSAPPNYNSGVKPNIFLVEDDPDISRLVRHTWKLQALRFGYSQPATA